MKLIKNDRYDELIAKEIKLQKAERRLQAADAELKMWRDAAMGECVQGAYCTACENYVRTSVMFCADGEGWSQGICRRKVVCPHFANGKEIGERRTE